MQTWRAAAMLNTHLDAWRYPGQDSHTQPLPEIKLRRLHLCILPFRYSYFPLFIRLTSRYFSRIPSWTPSLSSFPSPHLVPQMETFVRPASSRFNPPHSHQPPPWNIFIIHRNADGREWKGRKMKIIKNAWRISHSSADVHLFQTPNSGRPFALC